MSLHTEIKFEDDICEHLADHGWLYAEKDAAQYDRKLALFPADVLAWAQDTDPDAWETLTKNHGAAAEATLLKRLRDCLNQSGTLHVLRQGFDVLGLRKPLRMAQFKPALSMNPEIMQRYDANRLRVVRQVRYSLHNENSLDLAVVPEWHPSRHGRTEDRQHPKHRRCGLPVPERSRPQPERAGPRTAVVVSLRGLGAFCGQQQPSQNDHEAGRHGNRLSCRSTRATTEPPAIPSTPTGTARPTSGNEIWQREGWLEILGRYMVAEHNQKKQITKIIFPRFHQLDATRKLPAAVLAEGAGREIPDPAFGRARAKRTRSRGRPISWPICTMPRTKSVRYGVGDFGSPRDRWPAAGCDFGFERTAGVVATIKGDSGSKSAELAEALSGDKKIVVCTIQTFPFALEAVRELAATEGKRFAVIADEAHSSQTGEAAAKLKAGFVGRGAAGTGRRRRRSAAKTFWRRR